MTSPKKMFGMCLVFIPSCYGDVSDGASPARRGYIQLWSPRPPPALHNSQLDGHETAKLLLHQPAAAPKAKAS